MIVTCEACTTSFQLDEARIPVGGARVRCSRCKHAFLLRHPSDSSPDALHRIAGETAADAAPGVPGVSEDLSQPSPVPDPDEEDWQFNAEVRVPGDDEPDAGGDSDFDAGSDFGEDFEDASIATDAAAGNGVAPNEDDVAGAGGPSATEDTRDASSFGSVDDFSAWMEDEEPLDAGSTALELDGGPGDLELEDREVGLYSTRGGAEDLGDPESWDLIGGARPTSPRRSVEGTSRSAGARAGRTPLAPSSDFLDQFSEPSLADDDLGEPGALQTLARRIVQTLGWGATLALVAAAAFALLQPEWARRSLVAQRAAAGSFVAETSETSWVETSRVGTLLLVRGRSANAGSEPIWPRPVQIALLDRAGAALAVDPVRAGAPLPESVLRESQPEALEAARLAATSAFLGEPLAPGESRAFEVVVRDVPAEARRVLLQIAEPEPLQPAHAIAEGLAEPEPEIQAESVDQLGRVDDSLEASP